MVRLKGIVFCTEYAIVAGIVGGEVEGEQVGGWGWLVLNGGGA